MAFDPKKLERMAGGVAKQFRYTSDDTIATINASGYFGASRAAVGPGAVTDGIDVFDTIVVVANTAVPANCTIDTLVVTSARGVFPITTTGVEGITLT